MNEDHVYKIALIGNPNSGKSSLFNVLTGLRQSVGNFPGVTVDKKQGYFTLDNGVKANITDFPGLYSLYPNSADEKLVVNVLCRPEDEHYPDLVVYVADATNLERHFLLATQVVDLGIPMVFAINMYDLIEKEDRIIDTEKISDYLGVPVVAISSRTGEHVDELKRLIQKTLPTLAKISGEANKKTLYNLGSVNNPLYNEVKGLLNTKNLYHAKVMTHHHDWLKGVSDDQKHAIKTAIERANFENLKLQIDETMARYNAFTPIISRSISKSNHEKESFTEKIDKVLTHRFFGPVIFFSLMFLMFQSIYAWSETPMTWIEDFFAWSGNAVRSILPSGWLSDLLVDGVIAGLGGVMVFIPQITILFLLIAIMEETGYMSRAVYMFDDIMQRFGLNGRSIVALISSGACAIPAIMSTRTISNWKERINTIMVAPLISCSARLPVYTVLIGFAVPDGNTMGFNNQGLAFMGLYLLGILGVLFASLVFKYLLKADGHSYLMIELPSYKHINVKNVLLTVKEKVMKFITEAGKVILIISILLWLLVSYGPNQAMDEARQKADEIVLVQGLDGQEAEDVFLSHKIEASYAGHLGKFIEPVIKPLGFDWKIGIALITSFAAREVFVGTMATIYSVGSSDDDATIREKMAAEINPQSGNKVYNSATAWSLLIFYVFAMQCMSTLAVTKSETNSWKWPIIQFFYMGTLAYLGSWLVYNLLS